MAAGHQTMIDGVGEEQITDERETFWFLFAGMEENYGIIASDGIEGKKTGGFFKKDFTKRGPAHDVAIELQVAVLRHAPTPILVLSPDQTVIFANRAAERLLGSPEPLQSADNRPSVRRSRNLSDLGIQLLRNQTWKGVLDRVVSAESSTSSKGADVPIHEVEAVLSNPGCTGKDYLYRVLISTVTDGGDIHYILSFERSRCALKLLPRNENAGPPWDPNSTLRGEKMNIASFDGSGVVASILKGNQNNLSANKVGESIREFAGGDGLHLRPELDIWDDNSLGDIDSSRFPVAKSGNQKKISKNHRLRFGHSLTGGKTSVSVGEDCLYDDTMGEPIDGGCCCQELREYSVFTQEQQKQKQRLQSHETICNVMPHLVWTTTPEGLCDWFSAGWYKFTGMAKEESLGLGYQKAIHPDDLHLLASKLDLFQNQGNEWEIEIRYRRHDGVYKWMLARARPLRDKGKILKWYGTYTDIHNLLMSRIEAARNKIQMLTVLAHAEINLFSINKDRIYTMFEGKLLWESNSSNYDPQDKSTIVGKDAIEVAQQTQPGGIPAYEQNIRDILAGVVEVAHSENTVCGRIYRTRVIAELEHNIIDGGKKPVLKGVLGLSIDVTDMKQRAALEIENTRLMTEEKAAKESNRMKSQFLANMSHELRTPIAGVIGMIELLGDDPTLSLEAQDYVNSVQLSAKSLLTIVNDILDFSKIESGRLDIEDVPFNLSSMVGELCKLLGIFANQKGLRFIHEHHMNDGLEVLGDSGRIRQVLSNLLTNALKFTKNGMVRLSVTSTKPGPPFVNDEIVEVQFVIEDTGIGIERPVLEKLFRPFSQGDSSTARLYGGTGLGLTISKNLANLMGGSVDLESTPNIGSKATFKVPLKISSSGNNLKAINSSPLHPGFRLSIAPTTSTVWSRPPIRHSISQDLLNQQIGCSVTNSLMGQPTSIRGSADYESFTPIRQLSAEERRKIHVLVVEDNAINQKIALHNIRKLGFPATAVWNGCEALAYLLSPSTTQPRPDIILMDIQMPVMDGYEATQRLRMGREYAEEDNVLFGSPRDGQVEKDRRMAGTVEMDEIGACCEGFGEEDSLRNIPVIAMTASAIQGDREKCHEAGMDDYLAKPVEKKKLEEMLVKWAGRRRD